MEGMEGQHAIVVNQETVAKTEPMDLEALLEILRAENDVSVLDPDE